MNILELKNISYRYEKQQEAALKNITCSFGAGRLSCITGPSGAGKSTLLSLVAGLDVPTEGEIFYKGQNLSGMDRDAYRAREIGVIFQSYNLLLNATVAENVLLAMRIAGRKEKSCLQEAYGLLERLGIDREKADRKAAKLSGGEQQRAAIARALAGGSPILAADEPTGNLDGGNEAAIMEIFRKLAHEDGKCVIVVTHSPEAAGYVDEILELEGGQIGGN